MRLVWIGVSVALALFGCDDEPQIIITDTSPQDSGAVDANMGAGGGVGDMGEDLMDAGDASPIEMDAGDAGDDADPPTAQQVGVARGQDRDYVVWVHEDQLLLRVMAPDGTFPEDAILLDEAAGGYEQVAAITSGGTPWVAYGNDGGPIRLRALTQPDDLFELGVYGRPMISTAGEGLMITGRTPDGEAVSWQIVGPEDTPDSLSPAYVDDSNLPRPTSVAGVAGAQFLRFSDAGQCLYIDPTGLPLGNFPCLVGDGQLISDGQTALLSYSVFDQGQLKTRMTTVFGAATLNSFLLAKHEEGDPPLSWSTVGESRPMLLRELRDKKNFLLTIAATDGLWDSRTRTDEPRWLPNARTAIRVGTDAHVLSFGSDDDPQVETLELIPRINGREGIEVYDLDIPEACSPNIEQCNGEDEDCDGEPDNALCCDSPNKTFNPQTFDPRGMPSEILIADVEAANAYRFATRVGDRWIGWATRLRDDGKVYPLGSCDPANNIYCSPMEYECVPDEDLGFNVCQDKGLDGMKVDGDIQWRFDSDELSRPGKLWDGFSPRKGYGLFAPGGFTGLLAEDESGQLRMFWYHASRGRTNYGFVDHDDNEETDLVRQEIPLALPPKPPRETSLDGCDEVLAIDTVEHTGETASVLVVCSNQIRRMYPAAQKRNPDDPMGDPIDLPDENYSIQDLINDNRDNRISEEDNDLPDGEKIIWATITRTATDFSIILLGYRNALGNYRVRSFQFVSAISAPTALPTLNSLRTIQNDLNTDQELDKPIIQHHTFLPTRPMIQLRGDEARALVRSSGRWVWQPLVVSAGATQIEYATWVSKVVISAPYEGGTGFWVIDVTGRKPESQNLWSLTPAFTMPQPPDQISWSVAQGPYTEGYIIIFAPDEEGHMSVNMRTVECND